MATTSAPEVAPRHVDAVRRFSRFYTQRIRLLGAHLLDSRLSLPEGRLLYEVAHHEPVSGARLSKLLELDPGYVSRLLEGLRRRGVLLKRRARGDARLREFSLSARGRRLFASLDEASRTQVTALLDGLPPGGAERLVDALSVVERELGAPPAVPPAVVLRGHGPGDLGWVVKRHAELYHLEYGWDERFEVLVARIAADFLDHFDPRRERCWIAELDGRRVGSVLLVKGEDDAARLRLLLVDPAARGLGLGRRLVRECIRFAARAGYPRLTLWTNSVLLAARGIYVDEGFSLVASERHRSFGQRLTGEYWERPLP